MKDLIVIDEVFELRPRLAAEDFLQPPTPSLSHFQLGAARQVRLERTAPALHFVCLHSGNRLDSESTLLVGVK